MSLTDDVCGVCSGGVCSRSYGAEKSSSRPKATPSVGASGTYSNLKYDDETGDLNGVEIKIVPIAGERFQAAVLVSEGEPAPMVVVEVKIKADSVSFDVPATESAVRWSFQGTVTRGALRGTIRYASGLARSITLERRCGYWDR